MTQEQAFSFCLNFFKKISTPIIPIFTALAVVLLSLEFEIERSFALNKSLGSHRTR